MNKGSYNGYKFYPLGKYKVEKRVRRCKKCCTSARPNYSFKKFQVSRNIAQELDTGIKAEKKKQQKAGYLFLCRDNGCEETSSLGTKFMFYFE